MIGYGIATVECQEPDLRTTVPECLPCIAVMLLRGWRLLPPPQVNHEDVTVGATTLGRFRGAKAAALRRLIRWHFIGHRRAVEGELMTVHEFRARWLEDAAWRAAMMTTPRVDECCARLAKLTQQRAFLALEGERSTYGRMHGDAGTLAAFARFHEDGV